MSSRRNKKSPYKGEVKFKFLGFDWLIRFIEHDYDEDFGHTLPARKEINIFTKNCTDEMIQETLVHELEHVVFFEQNKVIFNQDCEKDSDKEEEAVKLFTPRRRALFKENPHLIELAFGVKVVKR